MTEEEAEGIAPAPEMTEAEWAEVVARSRARSEAYEAEKRAAAADREQRARVAGEGRVTAHDAPQPLVAPRSVSIPVRVGPLPRRPLYVVPPPTERDVEEEIRRIIPEAYDNVTWANLATLLNDERQPSLGAVLDRRGRWVRGAAAVRELQERMTRPKVILLGDTGAGKTIAAIAALEGEIRASAGSRAWVHVSKLKEPDTFARALSTRQLWIDDVGWELNGAKPDSGWIPGLRGPFQELIGQRVLKRGRLIATTALDEEAMAKAYNVGVARRVYEGAGDGVILLARHP